MPTDIREKVDIKKEPKSEDKDKLYDFKCFAASY